MLAEFLKIFFALFAVIDPFGNSLCFLGMTSNHTAEEKRMLSDRAILVSVVILFSFLLVGSYIFKFFSISADSLKVAGGIMLFIIGVRMIFGMDVCKSIRDKMSLAVVPLAMPFVSGPGVITTAMVMAHLYGYIAAALAVAANLLISWIFYRKADLVYRIIGQQWGDVISRIIGVILLAMAVEFSSSGIIALFGI